MTNQLVLFLDGFDSALMRRWMAEGQLPHLAALARRATWWGLRQLPGYGDGTFWRSVASGSAPEAHGAFFPWQFEPGTYRIPRRAPDREVPRETSIWSRAASTGRKIAVIDPIRGPLEELPGGLMLVDWRSHDPEGPPRSMPPQRAAEVVARFGATPWPIGIDAAEARGTASLPELVDQGIESVEARTAMLRDLLESGEFDTVAATISDAHDFGHFIWHLHDERHVCHSPEIAAQYGDPMLRVMRAIDTSVGELIAVLDSDAQVVVCGGIGMEQQSTLNPVLDEILRKIEFGADASDLRGPRHAHALARIAEGILGVRRHRRLTHRLRDRVLAPSDVLDRRERSYFALKHNANAGAVRFNLAGREPAGRIRGAAGLAAVRRDLERELRALRWPDGSPAVAEIVPVEPDPETSPHLPDLLVVWNRRAEGGTPHVLSDRIGEVCGQPTRRSGDHTDRAFCLFTDRDGSGAGQELAEEGTPMDLGEALLAWLCDEVPSGAGFGGVSGRPQAPDAETAAGAA